jgi:hypothetical protein
LLTPLRYGGPPGDYLAERRAARGGEKTFPEAGTMLQTIARIWGYRNTRVIKKIAKVRGRVRRESRESD